MIRRAWDERPLCSFLSLSGSPSDYCFAQNYHMADAVPRIDRHMSAIEFGLILFNNGRIVCSGVQARTPF
jgi:hypothetical protein